MDRKFAIIGFIYGILGLTLGIYMAASKNHGQLVTHAHIMLLGFMVSMVYAVCHKLWLENTGKLFSLIQFFAHQLGVLMLLSGLFLLYGGFFSGSLLEPLLSMGSIAILLSLVMMTVFICKVGKPSTQETLVQ
ncbi:MAG TPA: TonB-dependent receptor [Cellvibrio sp.]|nr:TonB-dependent receptor [Cellvibrio sp.]